MCFNKENFYLEQQSFFKVLKTDPILALFMGSIILIQLIEYFIWAYGQECNELNSVMSYCIFYTGSSNNNSNNLWNSF
jgi:hypothetical protein